MKRPKIVLLVGLPGCGKSTHVDDLAAPTLSSDKIRELLSDDADNQKIHARVFSVLRNLLKHRLELKRPVTYVDATNLTPFERRPYIRLARRHEARIEAIFFDVPVEECMRRNRSRERVVPEDVIRKMSRRLIPPTIEEGFEQVTVVK